MKPQDSALARAITGPQYFAIAFGATVGVAWMIILGDIVSKAGPGGAVAALAIGGVGVLLVGFCYAEMAGRRPAAGGEVVFAYELYGSAAAYAVGWISALVYIGACAFEGISIGVVTDQLFPGVQGPLLYTILGQQVHLGSILIGAGVTLAFWFINVRGTRESARLQEWTTYVRLVLMFVFLGIAVAYAKPANLHPLFTHASGQSMTVSFLTVLMTTPFWLSGFSVVACTMEESAVGMSMKAVGRAVVLSLVAALIFYCVLVLAISGLTTPQRLAAMKLPAAQAFMDGVGSPLLVKTVLIVALLGNLSAWNSLLIGGARVLYALGRAGLSASAFAKLNTRKTPAFAIAVISLITLVALPLGRGFILPVVNVMTFCFGVGYVITARLSLKLRSADPNHPNLWRVPGGRVTMAVALIVAALICGLALVQPWISDMSRIPTEWYVLGGWAIVGVVVWVATTRQRRDVPEAERWLRLKGHSTADSDPASL